LVADLIERYIREDILKKKVQRNPKRQFESRGEKSVSQGWPMESTLFS